MAVVAIGKHLHIGDAPLFARVGTQPVSNVQPIGGGVGFTGTLARVPHEGDRIRGGGTEGSLPSGDGAGRSSGAVGRALRERASFVELGVSWPKGAE